MHSLLQWTQGQFCGCAYWVAGSVSRVACPTSLSLQLRTGSGGFYSNNWGANPNPQRGSGQHSLSQSHGWCPQQIRPLHQKY